MCSDLSNIKKYSKIKMLVFSKEKKSVEYAYLTSSMSPQITNELCLTAQFPPELKF